VVATQNNLYASGTYPLPEPQLDRFLLSVMMALPDEETQRRILRKHADRVNGALPLAPVVTARQIVAMQDEVSAMPVSDSICAYITDLCENTRRQKGMWQGISARASIAVMRASQAAAYVAGHAAVHPDDVKYVFPPVMRHRIAGSDMRNTTPASAQSMLDEVLRSTPAP
jgi:MoxR-like ATPase